MLNNALHLLVNQLNTSQTRLLQPADLTLHEQLEGHLGHEEGWPGSSGVADGREDVQGAQAPKRVDTTQGAVEDLVEDVADARTTTELRRLNILGNTVDGVAVGGVEFGDDLK